MERKCKHLHPVTLPSGELVLYLPDEPHDCLGLLQPLELFIQTWNIKPAHLAKKSGYSRQHLLRVRMGRMEPTRKCMQAVITALSKLVGFSVKAADVFDLEERIPLPPYTV